MHLRLLVLMSLVLLVVLPGQVFAQAATEYEAYVVQQDQTLEQIATEYEIPVEYLARFNGLATTAALQSGQILRVPLVTDLTPQRQETAPEVKADTPEGDRITGFMGTIIQPQTQIWSQPGGGRLLYGKTTRGTEVLVVGQSGNHYSLLMSDGSTGYVAKTAVELSQRTVLVSRPTPPPTPAPTAQTLGEKLCETAAEYLGVPYKYGGRLPNNVDCSLLVQTVFSRHGLRLPRTASQQFGVGKPVEVADLQAGDRLYFVDRDGNIGHTGLYIGNGRFIHASSNRGKVAVDELTNTTYWKKFAGARR